MQKMGDLLLGDPQSSVGLCTLWADKEKIAGKLDDLFYICGNLYSPDGINYIIRNIFKQPRIRYLVLYGFDLRETGDMLVRLFKEGLDDEHRIRGTKFHLDRNIPKKNVELLVENVELIDMRKSSVDELKKKLSELPQKDSFTEPKDFPVTSDEIDVDEKGRYAMRLDPKGSFHIVIEGEDVVVDHYTTEGEKTKTIRGSDIKKIVEEILREQLVSQMDHAAYLGAELEKAKLSIKLGKTYVQDEELV